ncbi:MAG: hypothetical protein CMO80_08865 [Verrucomicrobiales bacterium]|nr:hypothetical protein [Verrucomicrobiales bacterium]|tara:strand:+ start:2288 stop:2605 length:318 start_codon:yes stop_codon:yes gene_type:complete
MRRVELLDLVRDLRSRLEINRVVIAGSQAIHAVARGDFVPETTLRSIEADIVLVGEQFKLKGKVFQLFGMGSNYLAQHGVVADPIGQGLDIDQFNESTGELPELS